MCGIWGALLKTDISSLSTEQFNQLRLKLYESFMKIKHRGPDKHTYIDLPTPVNIMLGFHRLAIMDPTTRGDQPFVYDYEGHSVYAMCNGEIYEHLKFAEKYNLELNSGSDCEVIPAMYKKYGVKGIEIMSKEFNSEHAFVLLDINHKTNDYSVYFSEDRFGIRPLFIAEDEFGFYFSSELVGIPCLDNKTATIERFMPRNYAILERKSMNFTNLEYHKYYDLLDIKQTINDMSEAKKLINYNLREAVKNRLISDRPLGCLLSGGVDSSLVAALASEHLKKTGKKLRTFCVGLPGATDAPFAKLVAEHIGSEHTQIELKEEDFLSAIKTVVQITGTFDITTIRATTGQYLTAKWVADNTNIKVLLAGENMDELGGSYLYFHHAPSAEAFNDECIRLENDIHLYDGIRADRAVAYNGLEIRFPYFDKNFVEAYLSVVAEKRMPYKGIEKYLLRKSFSEDKVLPDQVLWRRKNAFSDSVSPVERSWKDVLIVTINKYYTDEEFEERSKSYNHCMPNSKESLYYRELFTKYYGTNTSVSQTIPYFWLPKWVGDVKDPSARVLAIYHSKEEVHSG
jgi:asparagine synthase (glutamine-hydrolysing)